jgi:hypothetical protein
VSVRDISGVSGVELMNQRWRHTSRLVGALPARTKQMPASP